MKVSDLLKKSNLLEESRKDIAYVFRQNLDKTFRLERVNIDEILKNKRGNGLVNIQQRIEILKGTFNVATSAETGTFIKIEVPVSNLT